MPTYVFQLFCVRGRRHRNGCRRRSLTTMLSFRRQTSNQSVDGFFCGSRGLQEIRDEMEKHGKIQNCSDLLLNRGWTCLAARSMPRHLFLLRRSRPQVSWRLRTSSAGGGMTTAIGFGRMHCFLPELRV